jgi:hypothetical protein
MDNGWSKAVVVGKLPEGDERPVVVDMDPAADPLLFWAGKRNRREVPVLPLQRNEIVSESRIAQIIERARKADEEKSGAARQGHKKPASETPWTRKLWIYDLRTNKHSTLKTNPLKRADLDEFARLYNPANRHERKPTWASAPDPESDAGPDGRWRVYDYEELIAREKASLDIFWLKDESLAESDNLPPPEVVAQEIVEDPEAALEKFRLIAGDLGIPST